MQYDHQNHDLCRQQSFSALIMEKCVNMPGNERES